MNSENSTQERTPGSLNPVVRRHGSQCLVCGSRKSNTRIHTDNLGYDEVACNKHIKELEHHADETLGSHNGVMRWHLTSSGGVTRGVPRVSPNVQALRPAVAANQKP